MASARNAIPNLDANPAGIPHGTVGGQALEKCHGAGAVLEAHLPHFKKGDSEVAEGHILSLGIFRTREL